jgi:recombination protein RecA
LQAVGVREVGQYFVGVLKGPIPPDSNMSGERIGVYEITKPRRRRPGVQDTTEEIKDSAVMSEPIIIECRSEADIKGFLSTGSTILDLSISGMTDCNGRGGIPESRVTELFGPESSGKTYLAGELCGSAQRAGFDAIRMRDLEGAFEFSRAGVFGLNPEDKRFHYKGPGHVKCIEDLMGVHTIGKGSGRKKVFGEINRVARELNVNQRALDVTDSITVLPCALETEGKGKRAAQARAAAISASSRQAHADIATKRMCVVLINQARQKATDIIEYGLKRVVKFESSGGQATKHWYSVRVYLEEKGLIRDKEGGPILGVKIWAFIYKNKVDKPYRSCIFSLLWDYGIDDIRDNINWLKEHSEIIGAKGQWYSMPGRKKIQSLPDFIKFVETKGLEEEVANYVRTEWRKLQKPPDRKPRVR